MAPEQEALYALQWNVPRSELSMAAQLEYDRLRPAWERGEVRPAAGELEAARLAWEQDAARQAGELEGAWPAWERRRPERLAAPETGLARGHTVDRSGTVHTFHLRPVFHGSVGGLFWAIGAFFFVWPIVGLFTPGFYKGSSAWETAGILLMGCGVLLVCAWLGIRQFRNGAQVSGHRLTIRNEFRTYTVDAADIRAISLQPKSVGQGGTRWVARVELTFNSIWIDNFDCGPAGRPPRPDRAAAVEEVRALLGVRADDTGQPETHQRA